VLLENCIGTHLDLMSVHHRYSSSTFVAPRCAQRHPTDTPRGIILRIPINSPTVRLAKLSRQVCLFRPSLLVLLAAYDSTRYKKLI
jgi:hypothetical protein